MHHVFNRWCCSDEGQIELSLEAFLNNFHVQQTKESAAETKTQCARGFGFVSDRCIVQFEALQTFAQVFEVVSINWEQTAEHHRLGVAVTIKNIYCRVNGGCNGLTASGLAYIFDSGNEITHFTGPEFGNRCRHRHACTNLDHFVRCFRLHEQQFASTREATIHHADA